MSSGGASQYIRQVLHQSEPPPSINARFFYTSQIPIDDPLSPLPIPATANSGAKGPPKPFSEFDNVALDRAWHELRRKILRYNEEQGEKAESNEGSRTRIGSVAGRDRRDGRRGSLSRPATPRSRPTRPQASTLSQVDGLEEEDEEEETALEMLDESHNASEIAQLPDTTGTPFIRAPSRKKLDGMQREEQDARPKMHTHDTYSWDDSSHLVEQSPAPEKRVVDHGPTERVAVGVSRLHQVEMPELKMSPIYWIPVHDTAQVVRGTWFYRDSMLPVETAVANMLEAGYIDLQVWTETWKDELNSAVEVGAIGEEKIVHKLWPDKLSRPTDSRPQSRRSSVPPSRRGAVHEENLLRTATSNLIEGRPETPEHQRGRAVEAACDIIDVSTGAGGPDNKAAGITMYGRQGTLRTYSAYGVIYANATEACLLKPNLLPSAYYGRRPLANYIRKGHNIGIPVVRGFNQTIWDKLHPPKKTPQHERAGQSAAAAASGVPPMVQRATDTDVAKSERPKVTDLILVIHGIGQMLSQRMESFHFTHAMNDFRREVNVEAGTKEVKVRFRKNLGGIMVLPINWRQSLSLEDGDYRDEPIDPAANEFSLQDITPDTLPSVRNIVSDVMLDIPYYMSHHQPKMIAAVIREANRVYQLWCLNNPGFAENGRVHIIAHSLGSVMAIDILSRQPTRLPKHLSNPTTVDLASEQLDHLLFNTTNLFLAGSPAGFFLLLRRAQLKPRIDFPSRTAEVDPSSNNATVCGEQGQYGCIAVENIYNMVNGYDPVAYRMNAAVDAAYAASIKHAFVPSASAGWFRSNGSTNWFAGSGVSSHAPYRQPALPRLPSNVEMETHNFTREEIAEKRMYLLNDNGQIDYFLRYGGGPLEIQYLTMLSAHSSYWLLKDFTRLIVTEVGREPGRQGTLLGMRAVKKKVQLN